MADKTYTPKIYKRDGGDSLVVGTGAIVAGDASQPGVEMVARFRTSIANVNAGATLLPALPGYAYRVNDMTMIAVGGNVGTTTSIDINATQAAGSVKLLSVAIAALTRSSVVRAGASNASVLADGASFTSCDANTAITIGKTGGTADTATNIDVIIAYSIEAQ